MQKLIEQMKLLVDALVKENEKAAVLTTELNKRQSYLDGVQVTLDNFQAELLQREAKIVPVENIGEAFRQAEQLKAEAESEWNKIRGDWTKLDHEKAKFAEELRLGRLEVSEKKALYDRGAEQNREAREKLDERAAKLKAATQGV